MGNDDAWPHGEVPCKQLIKAAKKLGLVLKEGSRHIIVKQVHTGLHTQIPRHASIKRETARSIIEFFLIEMCISEKQVAHALNVSLPLLTEKRKEYLAKKTSPSS